MPENQILSLDLGSNSIGASIRNISEENQFENVTVITFETGVGKDSTSGQYTISLAANRTAKRSVRRLYQSRKYKLWAVLKALIKGKSNLYCPISEENLNRWKHYDKAEVKKGNGGRQYPVSDIGFANWIKFDFNKDGTPDYFSPYQLRNELATVKLDFSIEENRFKLGRALYHIAQHRGFKSSKIVKNKDDHAKDNKSEDTVEINIGAERKKADNLYKQIEVLNINVNPERETVGMIFAKIETEGIHHPERKTEGIRIRKNLHQYVTRKMLIQEVKHIFDFQGLDFNSIFGDADSKVTVSKSVMFWQRPLRSQKGLVGYCTLESIKTFDKKKGKEIITGKKRCPVSRPEFEEFRALSLINNIEYRYKGNKDGSWQKLQQEIRNQLYQEKFFVQKDFEFFGIHKWIETKNKHKDWELNYNFKTSVPACSISARLQNILGENWNKTISKIDKKGNTIQQRLFEDVWHVLFESDDQEFIEEYGKEKLQLNDEQIKKLVSLWFAMPVGYAQLSLKAINNILPFLREGFIYTDAVLLGKVPEILGEIIWNEHKQFITEALQKDVIEKNRNEKRILNIVNNLIAQYKAQPKDKRFAEKDFNYHVGSMDNKFPEDSIERDTNQILKACEDGYGKETWKKLNAEAKDNSVKEVIAHYQSFFFDQKRDFKPLPKLGDAMKLFIRDDFEDTFEGEDKDKFLKRLNKLYHPSMIAIYPAAREEFYKHGDIEKKAVMLGSPKTGAFKNPMAMRTLHELKKLINYYIATGQIDEETRVVVEVGRELVDTNKRWAYEKYHEIRRKENEEFANAIRELLKDPEASDSLADENNDSDIDKFRLWYEMIESAEGFEKSGKFTTSEEDKKPIERKNKKKSGKKESEDENEVFYEFSENHFDKIKKEVWVKLTKAKDNIVEKYRLWKEQQYFCIYTGKPIKITDLFQTNLIDIEHTIPRSMCFDNSLANKTVCYADFNRNIKKNQLPQNLSNSQEIEHRLEKWQQKVKDLEMRVEFWKGKSKQASTPKWKNDAIREKHLWQFELEYWRNKVDRFTMKEIKPGFKNSQLKDTQLISKYAFHYLKSYFNKVDVQKGAVTAEFRKIFDIQTTGTPKDRSKHSHHAKDAIVLSVIPVAAIRDKMLEVWFRLDELKKENGEHQEIQRLEQELQQLKYQCNLPKGLNNTIKKLDEELLINNIARNRSLIPVSKKVRIKGKDRIATGHAVQGQIHKDSFFGAIRLVKKDEDGKWLKNKENKFEFEPIKYVIREDLVYKKNSQSPGFKDLKDLEDQIVDKSLFKIISQQVTEVSGDFKEALNRGIWMLDRNGNRVNKIRRVRIALSVKEPLRIKQQSHINNTPSKILPDRNHKQFYYATNGENILCALYQKTVKDKNGKDRIDRELEIISFKDAADLLSAGEIKKIEDLEILLYRKDKKGNPILTEDGNKEKPYAILKPGMKVIFYNNNIEELQQGGNEKKAEYKKRMSYRLYKIIEYSGRQIQFQHHLEARLDPELKKSYPDFKQDEKGNYLNIKSEIIDRKNKKERIRIYGVAGTSGFTQSVSDALKQNTYNNFEPWPKLLYSADWLNMAIEGKHFEVLPDGVIKWH